MKNNNRIKRQRWRQQQRENFRIVRTYNKNDNLTPEQLVQLQKYENRKEKSRVASQRARDRKKQIRLQSSHA